MNDRELPYISVIITAYNRKNFLLRAIKSVVNQTLDKEHYEIIVIKNFTDDIIDSYIQNKKIRGIVSDLESLNGKLFEALNIARGTIISFLDDDDLFCENKLNIVYTEFKKDDNIVYYHNAPIPINEKYMKFNKRFNKKFDRTLGKSPLFNMSSISVRKSILNLYNLKKFNYNQDDFMYLSALESSQNIIISKEKLTYYMVHNSASRFYTDDINEYIKGKTLNFELERSTFLILSEIFVSKKVISYITGRIAYIEIFSYIFGINIKPNNIWDIFKNQTLTFYYKLMVFVAYILVRSHIDFRYRIIEVLFNSGF